MIELETSMETLGFTTRTEQYGKTALARINTHGPGEKTLHLEKGTRVLLLSLVYILNGNHDPKKVQRLNLVILAIFFAIGFFVDPALLPLGVAFLAIALVNGVNVLVVKKLSAGARDPVEREIAVHIHQSLQKSGSF
ncbi:MAG: hypothetical protein WBZ48_07670 [Bacteroidota bacterium]